MKRQSLSATAVLLCGFLFSAFNTYGQEDYTQWSKSDTIIINTNSSGYGITENLFNFPYLIRLSGKTFPFNQALKNGEDVRFSKSNGTPLSYQIELWDTLQQKALIWVKVDTILANSSTQSIKMYWGKASVTSRSNGPAVFDTANGFTGVWHLKEPGSSSSGGYADATAKQRNGTGSDPSPNAALSEIGFGQLLSNEETISIPAMNLNSNTVTMSAWIKPVLINDWASPLFCRGGTTCAGISLQASGELRYHWNDGFWTWESGLIMPKYKSVFVSLVVTPDNVTMYLGNSTTISSAVNTSVHPPEAFDAALFLGQDSFGGRFFSGTIDEVTISSVSRSAGWMKLCYLNQRYAPESAPIIQYPKATYTLPINEILDIIPAISEPADSVTISSTLPTSLSFDPANGRISGWFDFTCAPTQYIIRAYNEFGSTADTLTITAIDPTVSIAMPDVKSATVNTQPTLSGISRTGQPAIIYFVPAVSGLQSLQFSVYDLHGRCVWSATVPENSIRSGLRSLAFTADGNGLFSKGVYLIEMKTRASGNRSLPAQKIAAPIARF